MRTPDEIKKGLECCTPKYEAYRWKTCEPKCPYSADIGVECRIQLMTDALAYIQQLERERDAAVRDMTEIGNACGTCYSCKHWDEKHPTACDRFLNGMDCWEWRGVQEVE